eukprot:CAMPEP_0167752948 /NCGR_PEP_ID=MMETSP0110_2-20121227/7431_1 /TAXON_ID=629695 /ORGANISM="Gymnochlora sp., Strain CCMP2014" /LENGTH=786 /DNA_ID=CAMNT_0007638639 /DNA_START=188 /DNA_END=2548 /DNA_ORIENTATION=+
MDQPNLSPVFLQSTSSASFDDTPNYAVELIVFGTSILGLLFALYYTFQTAAIEVKFSPSQSSPDNKKEIGSDGASRELLSEGKETETINEKLEIISGLISDGANSFLFREYLYMVIFMVVFGLIVLVVLGGVRNWTTGIGTAVAFWVGCITSIASGFIGMRIAVFANSRTAVRANHSIGAGFTTAFKAGSVMGFALVSLGILVLMILIEVYKKLFRNAFNEEGDPASETGTVTMYECIAGYGLGGSSIAMFGRVGGGIYTKAADVGADLAGKIDEGWDEDDPRNPAVIADNVGDNVGDIAGMGADLFGSFAEATCAALVLCAQSKDLNHHYTSMAFPLLLSCGGLVACMLTSFVATHISPVRDEKDVEPVLKIQLLVSTILCTPIVFGLAAGFLPLNFEIADKTVHWYSAAICVTIGLWSGLIIGFVTEYYTSFSYGPTQRVARACETGAATNIIHGLALGYKSAIIPIVCISITIFIGYTLARMFGIACGALGILMTLATGLTIDAYGPITDNAGGIAEMTEMPSYVRDRTDTLDAAGNTTAAIGKGFAIGSAALVSLALFGAFADTVGITDLPLIGAWQFAGLVIGAMIPYWFFAMTMESVGMAANQMVLEVRRQVQAKRAAQEDSKEEIPTSREDYARCIAIATDASLKEMIAPGALVLLTPLVVGFLFGVKMLAGVLLGALASGVSMAVSASNTGGAWDNAKKYIGKGLLEIEVDGEMVKRGKGTDEHMAAIIGDTVGDPLKDTSGPALNIVMKLMAIVSLVFARSFPSQDKGGYLEQLVNA